MQSAQEKMVEVTTASSKTRGQSLTWSIIAVASVIMALLAIFTLSNWAEATPLHHSIQHVLLFIAGVGFGGSLVSGIRKEKVSNDAR